MRLLNLMLLPLVLLLPQLAHAQSECNFAYEEQLVESTGGALQILGIDGNPATIHGNWTPIRERSLNDRIRQFGKTIGRMDVCWENGAGKTVITYCTATLMKDNKILTNFHCTHASQNSELTTLGYFPVEARLLMGFDDSLNTSDVNYYTVVLPAIKGSPVDEADAQVFRVRGNPNGKWGINDLRIAEDFAPGEAMVIIHHPAGMAKMYSSVRCNIHDSQPEAAENKIRHRCDTAGGSSGSLLLRERDLAIVGLHHKGGLTATDHRSSNEAVRISYVAGIVGLDTQLTDPNAGPVVALDPAAQAWAAVSNSTSVAVLEAFLTEYPEGIYAALATARLEEIRGDVAVSSSDGTSDNTGNAQPDLSDAQAWDLVKETDSAAVLEAFLVEYPDGLYAALAVARLEALYAPQDDDTSVSSSAGQYSCPALNGAWSVHRIPTDDTLFVRSGPGSSNPAIGELPYDADGLTGVSCGSSGWCQVTYGCISGWSFGKYIKQGRGGHDRSDYQGFYSVTGLPQSDTLNIRMGPGTEYGVVAELPPNAENIRVVDCQIEPGYNYRWCALSWGEVSGWANGRYLADSSGRSPVPQTVSSGGSCFDLWHQRNKIFDDKGYCFKSAKGKKYFDNTGCYTSNPTLTSRESRLVQRIKDEEARLGC